jgi:hypothetical protein
MESTNRSEDWRVLCELASKEMDPDKLLDLVTRLNRALDEHNQRSKCGKIKADTIMPPPKTTSAEHHC